MVEFRKIEKRENEICNHEFAALEKFETAEGFAYLFHCKYCLALELRGMKTKQDEVPDNIPDPEVKNEQDR